MDIGIMTFNTDYGIRADHMAVALEAAGYESFWVPEHTHIPAERRSPYPGGGELPRPYYTICRIRSYPLASRPGSPNA